MKLLLQMSMMAGALILLVTVIRAAAINRLPKRCFVWLWAIVIIRLLIPVYVDVEIKGLSQDSAVFAGRRVIEHIVPSQQEKAGQGSDTEDMTAAVGNSAGKAESDAGRVHHSQPAGVPVQKINSQEEDGRTSSFWKQWGWSMIMAAGSIICLVVYMFRYVRGYRLLQEAIPLKGGVWESMVCCGGGRSKKPVLLVSDRIATPVTFGFMKPRIVLPKGMLAAGAGQLEFILQHEMVHIKRHDNLLILAGGCAACIHWFNPLVWLMHTLLVRDIEMSCDEKVISKLGTSKKADYAISLIEAAGKTKGQPAMFSAFGKTAIQERILSIMKYKKTSIISISAAVLLTISSLSVFAAAKEDSSVSYIVPVKTAAGAVQEKGTALAKGSSQEKGTSQLKEGTQEKNAALIKKDSQENAATLAEDTDGQINASLQAEEYIERADDPMNGATLKAAGGSGENTQLIAAGESGTAGEDGTAEEAAALAEDYAGKLAALQEKMKTANTENGDYDKYKQEYDDMLEKYDEAVEDWIRKDMKDAAGEYEKYGLTYDEKSGCFYMNGELVRCIRDGVCDGSGIKRDICQKENGTVDISICRDENHHVTGIEHCMTSDAGTGTGHHYGKHNNGEHLQEGHRRNHGEIDYIQEAE